MTARHYCTYFDHRYLARGLTMIRSLRRFSAKATIWVLCLDKVTLNILVRLAEPGVRPISLAELEAGDAPLAVAKADGRSLIEYYFTCTPSLILYVLRRVADRETVTYLDSDLGFFADPDPLFHEMGDAAVAIIPHRFPPHLSARECFGIYNVGWVTVRRDADGLECVGWWRARCLEWCRDYPDEIGRRYADQRYLDQFPELFRRVHVLAHNGANLAPWNLPTQVMSTELDQLIVNGRDPLLFFHFHGLNRVFGRLFTTAHNLHDEPPNRFVRRAIYVPYLNEVLLTEIEFNISSRAGMSNHLRYRKPGNILLRQIRSAKRAFHTASALVRGFAVWLPAKTAPSHHLPENYRDSLFLRL